MLSSGYISGVIVALRQKHTHIGAGSPGANPGLFIELVIKPPLLGHG